MKRMSLKLIGVLCAITVLCSAFAVSAAAISGGGSTGTGSVLAWGCDMSYYNVGGDSLNYSMVDFAKMKADGCDYVILRIGYEGLSSGLRNRDPAFVTLYNMARAAGMQIGVYYYTCRMTKADAIADAQWCINIMEENNMYFEYPIYYDVEYPGTSTRKSHEDLTSAETTALCLGWAETLEAAGYFPGVYAGYYVLSDLTSAYNNYYDTWIPAVLSATTGSQHNPAETTTVYIKNVGYVDFSTTYGMWQYKWYNYGGTQVYNGATWKDSYGYPLDCNVAFKDYPTIMQTYGWNNMVTKHTVSFETNGGTAVDPVKVTDGQTLTAPTAPTRYAFDFAGWYCNPELTDPYDFSTPVPYDFTLYAKWEEAYWGANTNLMPNESQLVLNDFNGQGAIWPYWNNDDYGSVTFYNGVTNDENWSWPSAYMAYENSFDAVNDTYIYLKKEGTAQFNAVLTYLDKNGEAHDVSLTDIAGSGVTDLPAGYLEDFYNVGAYIRNLGHAPDSGNVKFTKVTYFAIGEKDSYVKLYDLKLTSLFEIEGAYHTLYNKNVEQLSGVGSYVYDDGVLTMTADTAQGYSVKFTSGVGFDPSVLVNLMMDVNATAPFNITLELTNGNGDATMEFRNEFFNHFDLQTAPEALPAGNHSIKMHLLGYYEWNGGLVTESTIRSVTVSLEGQGTLALNALQVSRLESIAYVKDGEYASGSLDKQEPDEVLGDLNGDGKLTTADARLLVVGTVVGDTLTAEQLAIADYNGDGEVNTKDAREMLKAFTM